MTDKIRATVNEYLEQITYKSWTWEKLTKQEKTAFINRIRIALDNNFFSGTVKQVRAQACMAYDFFLYGAGYDNQERFK